VLNARRRGSASLAGLGKARGNTGARGGAGYSRPVATIIGGIGTSHVPTIGMAFDKARQADPDWKPLFDGYAPVARWLAEHQPDVLLFCFNDHATTFFFDHYPTFALGVSDQYAIADEGLGVRPIPRLVGDAQLARHIACSLVADEFDLTIFQDLPLDHGLHSPLTMMWPSQPDWPGRVIPLVVNVLQHPLPTPRRCFKLGQHLRKAILAYPEDVKVAIVGTGGLSHQMIGERAGFNNEAWDREFLDLIERDPEKLAAMTIEDFMRLGGNEGAEVIMWLIMRGALTPTVKKIHDSYYLPMTTAMAVALFE
jgi:protocatechuate 4,5-dioxygenase beta chain